MIRRPPRSTLDRSSAASDVYKRQGLSLMLNGKWPKNQLIKTNGCDQYDFGNEIDLDSVSYTHLRAHETVLDLVCRLLLEKKKTKTSQS